MRDKLSDRQRAIRMRLAGDSVPMISYTLRRSFPRAALVRRELRHLVMTTNEQHAHQALGFKTPAQYRRCKRVRRFPADFTLSTSCNCIEAIVTADPSEGDMPIAGGCRWAQVAPFRQRVLLCVCSSVRVGRSHNVDLVQAVRSCP